MPKPEDKQAGKASSVLIVEDEGLLSELLEKKMQQFEFKTFTATDVEQARAILKTEKVDAILLDIMLPGVNGITFLKELRADKNFQSVPVIICSNLGQEDEIHRGMQAGATEYIVKANVTPGEIAERLKKYING